MVWLEYQSESKRTFLCHSRSYCSERMTFSPCIKTTHGTLRRALPPWYTQSGMRPSNLECQCRLFWWQLRRSCRHLEGPLQRSFSAATRSASDWPMRTARLPLRMAATSLTVTPSFPLVALTAFISMRTNILPWGRKWQSSYLRCSGIQTPTKRSSGRSMTRATEAER